MEQLFRYLVTFHLFPSNLKAVLNILQQLYRYLATFPLFPSNLSKFSTSALAVRADLDILKHLYRYLAHFPCLSSYYKADLDTMEQLFR